MLTCIRFAFGALLFIPFVKRPKKDWGKLVLLSMTLYGFPLTATCYAIQTIDASIAALTSQLDVPFAWLFSIVQAFCRVIMTRGVISVLVADLL